MVEWFVKTIFVYIWLRALYKCLWILRDNEYWFGTLWALPFSYWFWMRYLTLPHGMKSYWMLNISQLIFGFIVQVLDHDGYQSACVGQVI